MKLVHQRPDSAEYFVVTWCFFNVCNYSCSYCGSFYNDGTKTGVSLEQAKKVILAIKECHPDKKLFFEFTGGEVTLFPQFLELMQFVKENGIKVAIISNGSQALSFWKTAAETLDHLSLSFHPDSASTKHFENLIDLLSGKVSIHLNLMMVESRFDELLEFATNLQKKFSRLTISVQTILNSGIEYSPRQLFHLSNQLLLEGIVARSFDFQSLAVLSSPHTPLRQKMEFTDENGVKKIIDPLIERNNSWKNWKCNAGIENLIIDWDGEIYRGWCKVGGRIGNVSDPDFHFPTEPVTCTKDICRNPFDIASTKTE